jgi:hypothetical protein
MPEIADKGVELDALAKMSPDCQARAVATVKSGDAPNIRAVETARPSTDEAEAAARKELTPDTAEPPAHPTTAQKWARYFADRMTVSELRDVRDAINEILAQTYHSDRGDVHEVARRSEPAANPSEQPVH